MAEFVELAGLDGVHTIAVASPSIYRIRPALPSEVADAVKIEFGADRIFTREELGALVARLIAAGCALVRFTSPDNTAVFLNRASISQIQMAQAAIDPSAAKTVLIVSGKRQAVVEGYGAVKALLGLT